MISQLIQESIIHFQSKKTIQNIVDIKPTHFVNQSQDRIRIFTVLSHAGSFVVWTEYVLFKLTLRLQLRIQIQTLGRAPPLGPISVNSMQFSANILPNNRLASPHLDPPLVSVVIFRRFWSL